MALAIVGAMFAAMNLGVGLGSGLGSSSSSSSAGIAERLAAIFPRRASFAYEPPTPGTYALPALKPAPEGSLLDHAGERVRLADVLAGRLSLISFVYLNCADAEGCPVALATLYDIRDASAQRPTLRNDLQLITISFDPARDTPETLGMIADTLAADREDGEKIAWRLFTGEDQPSLAPLLEGFGQSVQASRADGQINHLLRMYLVDRGGDIRNVYGLGTIDPRLIMTDVETLLMAERTAR